eukprot:TRINITY_DN28016_c0_g1_i1.p1 TRINITY_DN28016_c0_g1~~TRINITY_DN28016_c0_g1_i1.p1  ORF type:complete len:310 (+),score=50.97 TRINITY_DN28016_c0_g1_i1:22-951(+)
MDSPLLACGMAPLAEWTGLTKPHHLDFQQFLDSLSVSPLSPPAVIDVAKKAHASPYPPNWSEEVDAASGALYFYNALKEESSWQHPLTETFLEVLSLVNQLSSEELRLDELATGIESALADAQTKAALDLEGWIGPLGSEQSGDTYFYCTRTNSSCWEDPRERWKFDLHVRYDLLVGFLVSEEKNQSRRPQAPRGHDLTQTLTSLASSLSSLQSTLQNSLTAPSSGEKAGDTDDPEANGARWARPQTRRSGLPLPPRAASGRGALFSMPMHQRRYASDVLQQQEHPGACSSQAVGEAPPPPPVGAPPRY